MLSTTPSWRLKMDDVDLADAYASMASQELSHVDSLHSQVVRVIKKHRAEGNIPPAGMMEVWNFEHERMVDSVAKVKMLLEMYKK